MQSRRNDLIGFPTVGSRINNGQRRRSYPMEPASTGDGFTPDARIPWRTAHDGAMGFADCQSHLRWMRCKTLAISSRRRLPIQQPWATRPLKLKSPSPHMQLRQCLQFANELLHVWTRCVLVRNDIRVNDARIRSMLADGKNADIHC